MLKSCELSLIKKIIRGTALTIKELGWTRRKSRKSLTAALGIHDGWAERSVKAESRFRWYSAYIIVGRTKRKTWPVADKRLTINEKSICLVVKSRPDICSSISLSMGYLPRPTRPVGSRLTEFQPEATGKAFSEILFPGKRRNMPCGFVWRGCSRNCPDRIAARSNRESIQCNSVSGKTAPAQG